MKKTCKILFVLTLAFAMVYGFNAQARESSGHGESTPESLILDPDMSSRCQNDFIVENLDKNDAEIKITLGNEEGTKERIEAMGSKAYALQGFLQNGSRDETGDEMATIFNIDPNSRIVLHCKEKFDEAFEPG